MPHPPVIDTHAHAIVQQWLSALGKSRRPAAGPLQIDGSPVPPPGAGGGNSQ